MLGVEVAKWTFASGSGLIGAGLVGLAAGAAAYGLLVFAFASLRSPVMRLFLAAGLRRARRRRGYALIRGVTGEAVSSQVWRQIVCITGGTFVGMSALVRSIRKTQDQS